MQEIRRKAADPVLRKQAVVQYLKGHPDQSLASVGRRFGLSREWVRQIAKKAGIRFQPRRREITVFCALCAAPLERPPWRLRQSKLHFCNQEHLREYQRAKLVTFTCEVCGREYQRKQSGVRPRSRWCSKRCQGIWLARENSQGKTETGMDVRQHFGL